MKINDICDFFEIIRELKLDQDFIEYEEKQYLDNPSVMESLVKWRKILKKSENNYRDLAKRLKRINKSCL